MSSGNDVNLDEKVSGEVAVDCDSESMRTSQVPQPVPLEDSSDGTCMVSTERLRSGQHDDLIESSPKRALNVMFAFTSMPVGGAETLVSNLISRMDPSRFAPQICCLKELGPLGEELAAKFPSTSGVLASKYDLRVVPRLVRHMQGHIDALVTVGAGDKMFWGRIAARFAGVPVVLSALHSTGWPDGLGRLNRLLTAWTDAFIAVAPDHGRYLIEQEKLPREKVRVIPNGVDTDRFQFAPAAPSAMRRELGIPAAAPLCGIIAALRPEKDHGMFLDVARQVREQLPEAHFLVVGDGPQAPEIKSSTVQCGIADHVHFLGTRADIPRILSALNVFVLTSKNEANPVSILEALSVQVPVVATNVGSVPSTVKNGITGFLVEPGDATSMAEHVIKLMHDAPLARALGEAGRQEVVAHWSLDRMVRGYEQLIMEIYQRKQSGAPPEPQSATDTVEFCGAAP